MATISFYPVIFYLFTNKVYHYFYNIRNIRYGLRIFIFEGIRIILSGTLHTIEKTELKLKLFILFEFLFFIFIGFTMLKDVYKQKIQILKNCLNFVTRTLLIVIFLITKQYNIDIENTYINNTNIILLFCLFISPLLIILSIALRVIINYYMIKTK